MKDRTVQYPNRYKLTPVGGTSDTYDLTAVPGTVTEPGTVLNKANLLTDATAAGLGLSGDPNLNDAFGAVYQKPLRFTDVSVAAGLWTADATYPDYGYRADIPLTGVTATMVPDVVLPLAVATGGEVAPVAQCGAGYVRLYASAAQAAMTIPTITVWRAV